MGTSAITKASQREAMPSGRAFAPPSPFLGILPPYMWDLPKRLFNQPLTFLNLAANGNAAQTFRADTNHDFVAFYANWQGRATDNLTIPAVIPLLVDIAVDGGQSYNPANQPVDIETIFGNAKQPAIWAVPLIIPAGTGLTITLTNLHNATPFNVRVTLQGFQVTLRNQ
jgi:hypothetical protein